MESTVDRDQDGAVLLADLQGIQEWVTSGATELAVIGGGSLLLDEAFRCAAEALRCNLRERGVIEVGSDKAGSGEAPPPHGYWLPVVASGTLSGVFADARDAEHAARVLDVELRRRLPGASIGLRVGRFPPAAGQASGADTPFRGALQAAEALDRAAGTLGDSQPSPLLPGARLCAACGAATAAKPPRRKDRDPGKPWCTACIRRQDASQRRAGSGSIAGGRLSLEFRLIAKATRPSRYRGYMGVIAADGDGMGQRVMGITSPAELAAVSQGIATDVDRALAAGVAAAVKRAKGAAVPYNPVIRAGDDLCLVLPADLAIPAAAALCTSQENMPMSAGVLLCHQTLPFSVANDAAEELKKRAKAASRSYVRGRPHLAFAVESAASVREDLAGDVGRGLPYPAELVDKDLRTAALALAVAPSRAVQVVAALRQGGRVAVREWRRMLLEEPRASREALTRLYRELGASSDDIGPTPFLDGAAADSPARSGPARGPSPFEDLLLLRSLEGES